MKLAIVGATGLVGKTAIEVIQERNLGFSDYLLYSTGKQVETLRIFGKDYPVLPLGDKIPDCDFALFSAGERVSKRYAPLFAQMGCVVVDNSSAFRMDKDVPLIIPEINLHRIKEHKGIIANPNCSTIIMLLPLSPIHREYRIKKIFVATYQSVSGAGKEALLDLEREEPEYFSSPIKENLIPVIGEIKENGYTKEEMKMINETHKILEDENIEIYPTCIRVPVRYAHSEAITVETEGQMDMEEVKTLLKNAEGVVYSEEPLTPIQVAGRDEVFVSRLRLHRERNILSMWVIGDNLRKGAATNALQIINYLTTTPT